jgi:osmoprotectant transport system ATP-binding protein
MMDDNDIRAITVVDGDGKPLGFVKRREARNAQGDLRRAAASVPYDRQS